MDEFRPNREIEKIIFNEENGDVLIAGKWGCGTLTVEMVSGHMAALPWAKQVDDNGMVSMHNLFMAQTVVFKEESHD